MTHVASVDKLKDLYTSLGSTAWHDTTRLQYLDRLPLPEEVDSCMVTDFSVSEATNDSPVSCVELEEPTVPLAVALELTAPLDDV